jgi:hypothetical protein
MFLSYLVTSTCRPAQAREVGFSVSHVCACADILPKHDHRTAPVISALSTPCILSTVALEHTWLYMALGLPCVHARADADRGCLTSACLRPLVACLPGCVLSTNKCLYCPRVLRPASSGYSPDGQHSWPARTHCADLGTVVCVCALCGR